MPSPILSLSVTATRNFLATAVVATGLLGGLLYSKCNNVVYLRLLCKSVATLVTDNEIAQEVLKIFFARHYKIMRIVHACDNHHRRITCTIVVLMILVESS